MNCCIVLLEIYTQWPLYWVRLYNLLQYNTTVLFLFYVCKWNGQKYYTSQFNVVEYHTTFNYDLNNN